MRSVLKIKSRRAENTRQWWNLPRMLETLGSVQVDTGKEGEEGKIEIEMQKKHLPSELIFTAKTQRTLPGELRYWEGKEPLSTGALR